MQAVTQVVESSIVIRVRVASSATGLPDSTRRPPDLTIIQRPMRVYSTPTR